MQTGSTIKPRLVTHKMCPFGMYMPFNWRLDEAQLTFRCALFPHDDNVEEPAQKAWIALEVTGIPYEFTEIGLYGPNGKPDWFWKLNPKGTVPVLDCGNGEVWADSDLILDRLPQLQPYGMILQPPSPEVEQKIQEWRQEINRMLPIGKNAIQGRGASSVKPLMEVLRRLDEMVAGPYLCGSQVTVADCAAFPFLWRLAAEIDLDECPNLQRWINHCQSNNHAFRTTVQSNWWWWW